MNSLVDTVVTASTVAAEQLRDRFNVLSPLVRICLRITPCSCTVNATRPFSNQQRLVGVIWDGLLEEIDFPVGSAVISAHELFWGVPRGFVPVGDSNADTTMSSVRVASWLLMSVVTIHSPLQPLLHHQIHQEQQPSLLYPMQREEATLRSSEG